MKSLNDITMASVILSAAKGQCALPGVQNSSSGGRGGGVASRQRQHAADRDRLLTLVTSSPLTSTYFDTRSLRPSNPHQRARAYMKAVRTCSGVEWSGAIKAHARPVCEQADERRDMRKHAAAARTAAFASTSAAGRNPRASRRSTRSSITSAGASLTTGTAVARDSRIRRTRHSVTFSEDGTPVRLPSRGTVGARGSSRGSKRSHATAEAAPHMRPQVRVETGLSSPRGDSADWGEDHSLHAADDSPSLMLQARKMAVTPTPRHSTIGAGAAGAAGGSGAARRISTGATPVIIRTPRTSILATSLHEEEGLTAEQVEQVQSMSRQATQGTVAAAATPQSPNSTQVATLATISDPMPPPIEPHRVRYRSALWLVVVVRGRADPTASTPFSTELQHSWSAPSVCAADADHAPCQLQAPVAR